MALSNLEDVKIKLGVRQSRAQRVSDALVEE